MTIDMEYINKLFNNLNDKNPINCEADNRKRYYLTPKKILWESRKENGSVENSKCLLEKRANQMSLVPANTCILHNGGKQASILLDYGCEIHGGISILAWRASKKEGVKIRVRFGESAMEAMSEIGGQFNATNDHANRDIICSIGSMSMNPIGETGFRFARIDLLEDNTELELNSVNAILIIKEKPYIGSFHCNDPLLNRIWITGAYTVHLNMQNYIWDGIKRDRLIWAGDLHPEIKTIQTVFGFDDSVPNSLDFVRDETPLPGWMNGYPAYSMWWIISQCDWYLYTGDLEYLNSQKEYFEEMYRMLSQSINKDGKDVTPEVRFIDWPSFKNETVVDAGLQALHSLATEKLRLIFTVLKDYELAHQCEEDLSKLKAYKTDYKDSKQAAAMLTLSGLLDAKVANESLLKVGGSKGMSTFMGYYILTARVMAGDIKGCLDVIREYWGGMLSLGATSFWEDFDVDWIKNAAPIDEIIIDGNDKVNVHASYGGYCYQGYRHSLCHGWASGVTPWLSENILGVKILEPGCRKLQIKPYLGDLEWVEGSYPTPYGKVIISVKKNENGKTLIKVDAPKEIEVIF